MWSQNKYQFELHLIEVIALTFSAWWWQSKSLCLKDPSITSNTLITCLKKSSEFEYFLAITTSVSCNWWAKQWM